MFAAELHDDMAQWIVATGDRKPLVGPYITPLSSVKPQRKFYRIAGSQVASKWDTDLANWRHMVHENEPGPPPIYWPDTEALVVFVDLIMEFFDEPTPYSYERDYDFLVVRRGSVWQVEAWIIRETREVYGPP
jgi:hypothetical protein